jgi:16S rRNA (uracil1498-N3)-methyltransferase
MRRFYAPPESFSGDGVRLDAAETRHLRDVLRLKSGAQVTVFDGLGQEFLCTVRSIGKGSSDLALIGTAVPASPESPLELNLAAAMLKGEKFDLVVQKAVELGVTTLVPLRTLRCDVKLGDASKRVERWQRIAMEATKQSGRARLMVINEPIGFAALLANMDDQNLVLFSERDGSQLDAVKSGKKITALVGPEGGWDNSELEAARSSGVQIVTLGGRIMRAETAAIAVTALLQHRFGDLS